LAVQFNGKWQAAVLAIALVGTNGWWAFRSIDQGITNTYREQVLYEYEHRVEALQTLADIAVKGKSAAEAHQLLRSLFPKEAPYERDGSLNTAWIALSLSPEGRVLGVERASAARDASAAASKAGR